MATAMQPRRRTRISPEVRAEIRSRALFERQVDIARRLGIARCTISKLLKGYPRYRPEIIPARPDPEPTVAVIRIAGWLRAAANSRGLSVPSYLVQLADMDVSRERDKKLFDAPKPEDVFRGPVEPPPTRGVGAVVVQRILHLADLNASVASISQRCNISESTVRRVIAQRGQNEIRTRHAQRFHHGQRWGSTGGAGKEARA